VTTTSASPSPSTSADHQSGGSSATFVNFPSPSVIVSIATAVRNNNNSSSGQMCITESSSTPSPIPNAAAVATRYLNPADRDELIRNTGVVLGSGPIPASSFHQLASALIQLGAKHGAGVLDDFSAIATSPTFESLLPGIFKEIWVCRTAWTDRIPPSFDWYLSVEFNLRKKALSSPAESDSLLNLC